MHPPILAPSMLAADHTQLAKDVELVREAGARWLHIDIMDGHFVPNLTFGPQTVKDLRPKFDLFFDVHLMIAKPQDFVDAFAEAGADQITIHVEPDYDIAGTLEKIRKLGVRPAIVLNPGTEVKAVEPYLDRVELVLAMTVEPGFGGQSFQEHVLQKTRQLAAWRQEKGLSYRIQVDGGVNLDTAKSCFEAEVDTFVAGTAFFKSDDRARFRRTIEGMDKPAS